VSNAAWWRRAVFYEIYARSFQDSNDDGIGDLGGIATRLDHIVKLGADAIWLSPIYPSPQADFGFDITDFQAIDPVFGDLADFDAVTAAAHERGLRVVMDITPSHTSVEHPWFRDHPDWYVRVQGDTPPNNWETAFGTPAWAPDPLRPGWWYLHSFYPEQPNLDWSNPEVGRAMKDVLQFWIARGVDGFRLDSADRSGSDPQLRDDPPRRNPPPLPDFTANPTLDPVHSRNGPGVALALAALREAAGERLLIAELYLPTPHIRPYLDHVDLAFCFELLHAPFRADTIRRAIQRALVPGVRADGLGWVLSSIDFPRLTTRLGPAASRLAALLLLTLPGAAFLYQGDEIGLLDGPGGDPPFDRASNRDTHRHPMQWDSSPSGGFSDSEAWLTPVDPATRNVADQERDPNSLLSLYRAAVALRRTLGDGMRMLDDVPDGVLAFLRGTDVIVVLNLTDEPAPCPVAGRVLLDTSASSGYPAPATMPPLTGYVVRSH
jgi:alpha-glucosidase